MAWNEPGNNNSNKPDPWSGQKKKDGPPDLDQLLRKLRQQLINLFKKSGINIKTGLPSNLSGGQVSAIYGVILLILLSTWVICGFFIVQPAEKAIVLRFGQYLTTADAGLHWIPPLIENRIIVNTQEILSIPYQSQVLTQDENFVSVNLTVQYDISDPRAYLFNMQNPQESLQQATSSVVEQAIGSMKLDDALAAGQSLASDQLTPKIMAIMNQYQTGLQILSINIQSISPPDEVAQAFSDAIKAQQNKQNLSNAAQAYSNSVIPQANEKAKDILAQAQIYKQKTITDAQGATAQYLALLPLYQSSPEVTRSRLYLDAIENVYSHATKILLDINSSNNVVYLPLDKLFNNTPVNTPSSTPLQNPITPPTSSAPAPATSEDSSAGYDTDRLDHSDQPIRSSYPTDGDS